MSSKRSSRKRKLPTEPLRLEGESGTYFDAADLSESRNTTHERKDRQLCEQVAEALSFALAECHDPRLADLYVEAVEPAPSASRLRVVVSGDSGADAFAILGALERARSYLRRPIAGEIHRKRTPELCFELVAPEGEA
jgi:ribosome-binding factor A